MATIKEIAKIAGVSITTVSRVLNQDKNFSVSDETRMKILKVAEDLNYVTPHSRNKTKSLQNLTIGLIYWYTTEEEINDPYYFSIRLSIENECKKHGINLKMIYINTTDLHQLRNQDLDGMIALGKYSESVIQTLYTINSNLVIVDNWTNHYNVDTVVADLNTATQNIIEYYHSKNISTIGLICGVEETFDGEEILDIRLTAYRNEMFQRGLFNNKHIYLGQFTADSGYEIMCKIIDSDELLDAYIIASDAMAIGCLKALNEKQIKVPDVVSLISYDNTPVSQFTIPSLSTVHLNTKIMGQSSVTLLLEKMTSLREIGKKVVIPTKLILRDSSI